MVMLKQAGYRFARSYMTTLHELADLYAQGNDNMAQALEELRQELDQIEQAQSWAASQADSDDEAAMLCNKYPAMALLSLCQTPEMSLRWLHDALKAARRLNLVEDEGRHLSSLGLINSDLGQYQEAIEYYREALEIAVRIEDGVGEIKRRSGLGLAYMEIGNLPEAVEYLRQSVMLAHNALEFQAEANNLGNLGIALYQSGQANEARQYFERAFALQSKVGNKRWLSTILNNLALTAEKTEKALQYYGQAIELARELNDLRAEANALANMGVSYKDLQNMESAIRCHEKADQLYHQAGEVVYRGANLGNLANAYLILEQYDRAAEYYQQALIIARNTNNKRGEALRLNNLGVLYEQQGLYDLSIDYYQQACVAFLAANALHLEQKVQESLARARALQVQASRGEYPLIGSEDDI